MSTLHDPRYWTDYQPEGDSGGELDPHGPDAVGNPIGGNVTSDVSGQDVFYEEVSRSSLRSCELR